MDVGKQWDFLYEEIETGERFFVECSSLGEAEVILEMSGYQPEELEFIGRYTVEEAEAMGYDTY